MSTTCPSFLTHSTVVDLTPWPANVENSDDDDVDNDDDDDDDDARANVRDVYKAFVHARKIFPTALGMSRPKVRDSRPGAPQFSSRALAIVAKRRDATRARARKFDLRAQQRVGGFNRLRSNSRARGSGTAHRLW